MKTVTLQAFTDRNGSLGLGVRGMPRNEDTDAAIEGATVAHDLIEHVNGVQHIGSIDDELEALGALWYVRGQHGQLFRNRSSHFSPAENIAGDVVRMFADFYNGAYVNTSNVPRTRACEADASLRDILAIAIDGMAGEVRDSYRDTLNTENEIADKQASFLAVCIARMRIGYRKARAMYEKRGRFAANNLYWEIAEAVEPFLRGLYEGAEFTLTYGFGSDGAVARCSEAYDDYDMQEAA